MRRSRAHRERRGSRSVIFACVGAADKRLYLCPGCDRPPDARSRRCNRAGADRDIHADHIVNYHTDHETVTGVGDGDFSGRIIFADAIIHCLTEYGDAFLTYANRLADRHTYSPPDEWRNDRRDACSRVSRRPSGNPAHIGVD